MVAIFALINSFFRIFFKLNFVCFITPVVEKWLIHTKKLMNAPVLLVLPRVLWLTIRLEAVRKSLRVSHFIVASHRGITVFAQQYICIWAFKNSK